MDLREEIQQVQSYYVMESSKLTFITESPLRGFCRKLITKSISFIHPFRPTLDEIRGWGKNFDKLMRSPGGRKVFRDFLRCEYSEENILFWLACEELKKETNAEAIEEKARFIYEDYISILSPKEVSHPHTHTWCIGQPVLMLLLCPLIRRYL